MSFWSAPIIEQPIHKSACEKSENLGQKARDYLDRFHLLPRFLRHRESATRPGNPFNKRVTKSGKAKMGSQLGIQLHLQQRMHRRQQNETDLTIWFIMFFLPTLTAKKLACLSATFIRRALLPLTGILQRRIRISAKTLGNV
jgi:hypothetical protein